MQNAVVLIFATQVLLSIALPLDIVLPKDKRSEDISDLKSGVQLLFEYLVKELLRCNNDRCGELMIEVLKTYKEGTEFLNKTDNDKGLSNALNMTTKVVIRSCSFFMKTVYSKNDLFDSDSSKYRELQYKLLTFHQIYKLKKVTDNLRSGNVRKCKWLQESLPELNIRRCARD